MNLQSKIRIMLVGGGTGGHTFPLVAVAESLRNIKPDIELACMGDQKFLADTATKLKVPFIKITGPKWDRTSFFARILALLSLPLLFINFIKCMYWMWRFMPDAVFVKGGYPSVIPAIVAKIYFIPLYVHESDAIAGSTNRFLGRLATKVFLGFEEARQFFDPLKTEVVGVPLRKPLPDNTRDSAIAFFAFTDKSKPTIFFTGASQGAKAINDVILTVLIQLCQKYNIIHQCGDGNFAEVSALVEKIKKENQSFADIITPNYKLYGFMDDQIFQNAVLASDVILTRAGSSLFEFSAYHKPIIAIPLPSSANDHQRANAYAFSKFGVKVIEQDNITPNVLIYNIDEALKNSAQLSAQLEQFNFNSADIIATSILNT